MSPKRGEIWWINFEPQTGSEMRKSRPAVVINVVEVGKLPLRIVVPITEFNERRSDLFWFVPIEPTRSNGLLKFSQADCFQVKSVSVVRFGSRIGVLENEPLQKIVDAVALCIGA